jgi:hypothetical protein
VKLTIEEGGAAGQDFPLTRPVVTLGRGRENDIVLLEHGVSRQHARIQHGPQGWTLTDLGSTNGTLVNGQRIRANESYLLQPGDRLTMGSSVLVVHVERDAAPEPATGLGAEAAPERETRRQPAMMIAGALLLVVVLVGIVVLLVIALQPKEEEITTPTPGDPMEQFMTVVPVPTEAQDIVTAVLPLIPTGLFPLGATATPPPPGAAIPGPPAQVAGRASGGRH